MVSGVFLNIPLFSTLAGQSHSQFLFVTHTNTHIKGSEAAVLMWNNVGFSDLLYYFLM